MEITQLSAMDVARTKNTATVEQTVPAQTTTKAQESFSSTLLKDPAKVELAEDHRLPTNQNRAAEVEKSLEKMMLSLLMKPMFAEFAEFTFGKGVEADHYTSLFSDAVAEEITAGSSFGLGKYTDNLKLGNDNS